MRISVIGSGISGMVAAYLLSPAHEVSVFEGNDYIGGHAHFRTIKREKCNAAMDRQTIASQGYSGSTGTRACRWVFLRGQLFLGRADRTCRLRQLSCGGQQGYGRSDDRSEQSVDIPATLQPELRRWALCYGRKRHPSGFCPGT